MKISEFNKADLKTRTDFVNNFYQDGVKHPICSALLFERFMFLITANIQGDIIDAEACIYNDHFQQEAKKLMGDQKIFAWDLTNLLEIRQAITDLMMKATNRTN